MFQGEGVAALGGVDAALGAAEGLRFADEHEAHILPFDSAEFVFPDGCGGGHVAAAEPFGTDEIVDEAAFFGSGRIVAGVVFGDEGFVVVAVFGGCLLYTSDAADE